MHIYIYIYIYIYASCHTYERCQLYAFWYMNVYKCDTHIFLCMIYDIILKKAS